MTKKALATVEAQHGFVFGDPDDEAKRARQGKHRIAVVQCNNPNCADRTQFEVFEDTELPVKCGACFNTLVADPNATADSSLHVSSLDLSNLDDVLDAMAERAVDNPVLLDKLAERVARHMKSK